MLWINSEQRSGYPFRLLMDKFDVISVFQFLQIHNRGKMWGALGSLDGYNDIQTNRNTWL